MNFDCDALSSSVQDTAFWTYHTCQFDESVSWSVDFSNEVTLTLVTYKGDSGLLAAGMWWTKGFKEKTKIPIYDTDVRVIFDICLSEFRYEEPKEWLRIALACAVQRENGEVIYTELDFKDSPNTLNHPKGNIRDGGDIVYQGGNVVEFKLDEIELDEWVKFDVRLTDFIDRAWKIKEGDKLESVYIVIESENNPVRVQLSVDNLQILARA